MLRFIPHYKVNQIIDQNVMGYSFIPVKIQKNILSIEQDDIVNGIKWWFVNSLNG